MLLNLMVSEYDLETQRVVEEIKKSKAKRVLIQLPDGLKPKAVELVREIEKKTEVTVVVWAQSNFGACDLPVGVKGFDLLIAYGHAPFFSSK